MRRIDWTDAIVFIGWLLFVFALWQIFWFIAVAFVAVCLIALGIGFGAGASSRR